MTLNELIKIFEGENLSKDTTIIFCRHNGDGFIDCDIDEVSPNIDGSVTCFLLE